MSMPSSPPQENPAPSDAVLSGITVLDFTHAAAGPMCTMLLGDFGARVLKIEKPGRGDGARHMRMSDRFSDPLIGSDYYLGLNRNKQSVGIDLGKPEGVALAQALAAKADVLVQNFRPGTMDKLGLGYEALSAANPRLIYCDIAAFPPDGPLRNAPGMDIVAQARAGTIAITGYPGGEPMKPGPSLADLSTGLQAVIGILLALRSRDATGQGQRVALNLYHSTMLMLANYASVVLNTDHDISPMGSGHPQLAPYQAFPTRDRWLFLAVGTNDLWHRLCAGIGLEALRDDPRFVSNYARVKNKPELVGILSEVLRGQPSEHWLRRFDEMGIPSSPIVTPRDSYLAELEQGSAMVSTVDHPDYGRVHLAGLPITLSASPAQVTLPPPRLGDDTNAVLGDLLGLDEQALAALQKQNVINQYAPRVKEPNEAPSRRQASG